MTALRYVPKPEPSEPNPMTVQVFGVALAWVIRFFAASAAIIFASVVLGLATRIFLIVSGVVAS